MALKVPYATVLEADVFLADKPVWLALATSVKDTHLLNARYYIDANYSCTEGVNDPTILEEFKFANSVLAEIDSTVSVFTIDDTAGAPVVSTKVEAGSVSTEKTYAGFLAQSASLDYIDKYPRVTNLLSAFCSLNKGGGVKTPDLLRV